MPLEAYVNKLNLEEWEAYVVESSAGEAMAKDYLKGTTRTIVEEALRLLQKQEHLHMFDDRGTRSFSMELQLTYTIQDLENLLRHSSFADDNQPMSAKSILANVIHYNSKGRK